MSVSIVTSAAAAGRGANPADRAIVAKTNKIRRIKMAAPLAKTGGKRPFPVQNVYNFLIFNRFVRAAQYFKT